MLQTKVLIAGGGPVGSLTSLLLRRLGIPSIIAVSNLLRKFIF